MRSLHTRLGHKTTLASALLILTGLTLLPSAQAQELDLGQYGTKASGTATLTDTGSTASGTYAYDDYLNTGIPLSLQTSYYYWNSYGSSMANISGGSINFLQTYDTSTVNVSGGNIFSLNTESTGTTNVSGGSISVLFTGGTSTTNVSGGSISYLGTLDTGTIDLFGTGFTKTLIDKQFDFVRYNVKGTLQDGTRIDATYDDYYYGNYITPGGKLLFSNPVPEASSVVSFGLLLVLGLSRLAVSARQRSAAVAG